MKYESAERDFKRFLQEVSYEASLGGATEANPMSFQSNEKRTISISDSLIKTISRESGSFRPSVHPFSSAQLWNI